jgi:hypothetical protein
MVYDPPGDLLENGRGCVFQAGLRLMKPALSWGISNVDVHAEKASIKKPVQHRFALRFGWERPRQIQALDLAVVVHQSLMQRGTDGCGQRICGELPTAIIVPLVPQVPRTITVGVHGGRRV